MKYQAGPVCYTWRNKITGRKQRYPANCEKQMTVFTDCATNQEVPKQVDLLGFYEITLRF